MSKPGRLLAQIFVLLLFVSLSFAGTTGKISGVVKDATTGEPLFGVNVVVSGTSLGAATGADGKYFILNVPPGLYELQAQYIGYAMTTTRNVRVTVDITTTIDVEMGVEAIQGENVIVVSKRPLIERKATNERRVVRSEDLENLPIRDAQDIIALQTGAVQVGDQLHIRGGRREEVAYYVDGVYQVNDFDRFDRPEAGDVSSQALEEVSFQAGGFDAEYGNATAGLINMSTKTGGQKFKISGEAATDEFLSREKPGFLDTYSYGQNVYNLSIGGPITNAMTFYANAERQYNYDRDPRSGIHAEGKYLGDLDGDGVREYDEYEVVGTYGPLYKNWEEQWSGTGNLLLSLGNLRAKFGGNFTDASWSDWDRRRAAFNAEHTQLWKSQTYSAYARFTYTLNANALIDVQYSRFKDAYQNGNPFHWDDYFLYGLKEIPLSQLEGYATASDQDAIRTLLGNEYETLMDLYDNRDDYTISEDGMLIFQPELPRNGVEPSAAEAYARYRAPGTVFGAFEKNETGYHGINGDLKMQVGSHEMRIGGEFRKYLIRYYRIGSPERLTSTFLNNTPYSDTEFADLKANSDATVRDYATYDAYMDNYWFQAYKNAYAENMGYTVNGADVINEALSENRDGPRQPIVAGFFIQDKVELDDLIMNLGFRFDHIDPNNFNFRDPANIVLDSLGSIAENVYLDDKGIYSSYEPTYDLDGNPVDLTGIDQLVEREPFNLISPRLGLAFPVTDRTVFHAQYGKYVQQPQLNRLFLSYLRFAANLSQGNYTTSGNPDLNPVRTTSYEIGFKQQITDNSSIDLTVFYKQLTDYVQIRNEQDAKPVVYAKYVNGDYGSVKGLSFSYNLRRTGYVQAFVNYTLQYAGGTGSTGAGQYKIAWQSGNYPTFVSPLDFDQRHTGSVNVDFRTKAKDVIPEAGLNLLFTFGSGRRFTPMQINSYVFPNTSDTPIAALNSGTMPAVLQLDAKLDKNWTFGGFKFNTYMWIKNVTNRANVFDVHNGTGQADYDGWFNTGPGQAWLANPNNNTALYNLAMQNPEYFQSPRSFLLGVRFFLNN